MMTSEIVQATTSFLGDGVRVAAGELRDADDPIVRSRPHLFRPVAGTVRTTATVPGPVAEPPPFLPGLPAVGASKAAWAAYCASFDVGGPSAEELEAGNSKDGLRQLAARLREDAGG